MTANLEKELGLNLSVSFKLVEFEGFRIYLDKSKNQSIIKIIKKYKMNTIAMNLGKSFEIPKESKTAKKEKINIKPSNILSDIWTLFFTKKSQRVEYSNFGDENLGTYTYLVIQWFQDGFCEIEYIDRDYMQRENLGIPQSVSSKIKQK